MPKLRDLTGQKFGMLEVVSRSRNLRNGAAWNCRCDCGNTKIVGSRLLILKHTSTCGCISGLLKSAGLSKHGCHGKFSTPIEKRAHSAWTTLRRRCYDKNFIVYPNYGGRGIRVCNRWRRSFEAFLSDLGLPGINYYTIFSRLRYGWTGKRLLSEVRHW